MDNQHLIEIPNIGSYSLEIETNTPPSRRVLIDHKRQIYPFCIVWTRAPQITRCIPCIGHVGIAGYL